MTLEALGEACPVSEIPFGIPVAQLSEMWRHIFV